MLPPRGGGKGFRPTDGGGGVQHVDAQRGTNGSFGRLRGVRGQRHVHEHFVLVTTLHRQIETFRTCDEGGLCFQVLTELFVVVLYRGLRQV